MSGSDDQNRIVLASLVPSWLAFGWIISKAQWFWNHRPDLQFGWVVLLLCAFIIWDGWSRKPAPIFRMTFPSIALFLIGSALLFIIQAYETAFGMKAATLIGLVFGCFLIIAGNLLYVFGWPGIRHFAFGFGFLLIALPIPAMIYLPIVQGLQAKVAAVNVEVLNLIGIPAQRVGSLIHLPNGTVGVDEACSGIRSLQSTLMATLFIGYLTLKSRGLQIMLLVSGIGLAILGNLVRSLFLSYNANARGLQSVDATHDAAGWSILAFTAIGVAVLGWLFHKAEAKVRELQPVVVDQPEETPA